MNGTRARIKVAGKEGIRNRKDQSKSGTTTKTRSIMAHMTKQELSEERGGIGFEKKKCKINK